jgi:hypothetical protein
MVLTTEVSLAVELWAAAMATMGAAKKMEARILIVLLVDDVIKSRSDEYQLMLVYLDVWVDRKKKARDVFAKKQVLFVIGTEKERASYASLPWDLYAVSFLHRWLVKLVNMAVSRVDKGPYDHGSCGAAQVATLLAANSLVRCGGPQPSRATGPLLLGLQ